MNSLSAPGLDLAGDASVLVSEADLAAAMSKHVIPVLEQHLLAGLKAFLDAAIKQHMQHILLTMEEQQQKVLEQLALINQNPPQAPASGATRDGSTPNRHLNRSHTMPTGRCPGDLVPVMSACAVRNQPRRLTAGCIDKLVMNNAIRNAGYFDKTSFSAVAAWEEADSMSKKTDDTQSSKSLVIPGGLFDSEFESVVASIPPSCVHESEEEQNQEGRIADGINASTDSATRAWDGVGARDIKKEPRCIQCLYLLYALWGITSWSSSRRARLYRIGVRFASVCATGFCIVDLIQEPSRLYERFAEAAFSVSSLVSLAFLGDLECIIGQSSGFLGQYAKEHKFLPTWSRHGMRCMVLMVLVWLCRAATGVLQVLFPDDLISIYSVCRCSVMIYQAGLYLAIVHSVYHVLTFLELMLDAYTTHFCKRDDWASGVQAWNVLQAILHNLSHRVDSCFLAVQTSAAIAFLCYAAQVFDSFIVNSDNLMGQIIAAILEVPSLMMAFGAFVVFVKAAGVTETCARVPPVMNAVKVEGGNVISSDRHYLVSFIFHSQAGFCIKGSRVDATMLMNYCYICGAIVCGLFTTGLSMSRQQ